jgi:putative ABC transport system permease protein
MKSRDLLELAGRNLREAILRNSLTTLGIAVGVASLVAMLSLGVGLQQMINKRMTRSGLFNAVFVTQRQNFRGFGEGPRRGSAAPGANDESRPLDDAALELFKKVTDVVDAYPEIRVASEVHFEQASRMAFFAGLPTSAAADDAFEGMKGRFFSSPSAEETILQVEFARDLKPDTDSLIGQDLVLRYMERQPLPPDKKASSRSSAGWGFAVVPRERKLRIVGIIETSPGAGFGGFGRGGAFVPLALAQNLRSVQNTDIRSMLRAASTDTPPAVTYSSVTVRAKTAAQVPAVENTIKQMGFGTFSLLDATRNLRRVFAIIDLFLGIFGSLALAVASLGIINTLVMAILERRREIGILKALGAGDQDVRQLFFAEAGAMGIIGGALGVFLGWLMGQAINFGTKIYLSRLNPPVPPETVCAVPWWLVGGAIGFATMVSLVAGMYPASRAARLNPVEALRYE